MTEPRELVILTEAEHMLAKGYRHGQGDPRQGPGCHGVREEGQAYRKVTLKPTGVVENQWQCMCVYV